jgi:hypothetical protein
MKTSRMFILAITVVFCCYGMAFADNWKDHSGKESSQNSRYTQGRHDRVAPPHGSKAGQRYDKQRSGVHEAYEKSSQTDYRKHPGYREAPRGKGRHYGHYTYRKHRYDYRGHWDSWKRWELYAKAHPEFLRYGHYYRENSHLMFRFCEPGTGTCFFFSIGR